MKKENEFNKGFNRGMVIGFLLCFAIASLISMIYFDFYTVPNDYYISAMNTIAELKCPMMQYETKGNLSFTSVNNICDRKCCDWWTNFSQTYPTTEKLYQITYWNGTCVFDYYHKIYQNFTTSRYLPEENMIECSTTLMPNKEGICCGIKSQKFTLEEFGLK